MKTLLILLLALAVILIVIAKIHPIGKKISLYIVLGLIALIMLVPFYMMFVMATHTTSEIYSFPPALWFGTNLVTNFHNMVAAVNFPLSFLNSCIVTFGNVILVLFFCSIGGYAFSVYQFPGKKVLFATVYKGNIIKNLIMDCQSYTKYRPNETTGGIFVSWRRKEELPTGA